MGKLSLKKKDETEKQQKISSFFAKPTGQPKKPSESPLFPTVQATGTTTSSKQQVTDSLGQKATVPPSSDEKYSRHFTHMGESRQTVIPETQCSVTPVRRTRSDERDSNAENCDSDSEIIPATPDAAPASSKSRAFGRSFLSSNLTHLLPHTKPQDKPPPKESLQKGGGLKTTNKKVAVKQDRHSKTLKGSWNSADSTMSRVLNDMGVPEVARAGLGLESAANKVGPTHPQSAVKRSHPSGDGESPPYKKKQGVGSGGESPPGKKEQASGTNVECPSYEKMQTLRNVGKSPAYEKKQGVRNDLQRDGRCLLVEDDGNSCKKNVTGSLQGRKDKDVAVTSKGSKDILGAGTRGRLILENSLKVSLKKGSDSSSEEGFESDGEFSGQRQRCIMGNVEENMEEQRKFSFNKKKGKEKLVAKETVKTECGRKGVKGDLVKQEDVVLDDILGNIKQGYQGIACRGVTEETVPSVGLKKKKRVQLDKRKGVVCTEVTGANCVEDKPVIDHTEIDDALQDIMAELKKTLTEQNELSARKSSGKKRNQTVQSVHREREARLNSSISKQLHFDHSTSTGKPDQAPPPVDPDDVLPLDGHVTDSKACSSLFQEDSWVDDSDLVALDITTSPFKEKLNHPSDGRQYDPSHVRAPAEAFGRHVVKQVQPQGRDVVLEVEAMQGGIYRKVILQGYWTDTHVAVGDVIHVIGEFDPSTGTCHITDEENFMVVSPDLLISGTSVVSTVYCMRKSVLNEKFKGTDSHNIHMLHGTIIHAFFQEVLQQRHLGSKSSMEEVGNKVLRQTSFLHEMYGLGVTQDSVMAEIGKFFPQVTKFLEMYMSNSGPSKSRDVEIQEVKDIEENVWSPRFGIKGKIDLTVEVTIHGDRAQKSGQSKVMPLELKTGKASFSVEHKGQVTLYSMMSSDRREDPAGGLLLYLRESQMRTIPAHYSHKRGLIQLRNELAHYLRSSTSRDENGQFGELPPPINNERSCGKCPHLLNCTAYGSVIEKRSLPPSHTLSKLTELTLGHLTPEHLEYFRAWCELMHLELTAARKTGVSQLWCKTAYQREESGEALCGMVLSPQHCQLTESEKVLQCFHRHPYSTRKSPLTDVGLTRGDNIVVSAENQPLIALCMGNVQEVTDTRITLLVDRDLRKSKDYKDLVYRLDKCDTYNTMATNFTNLSRLMENSDVGDKLRELIIEKRPPQFELTISRTSVEKVKQIFKTVNKPQKTAILKVLMCKDYVLIKGYPGTGKTSTIVALVRILSLLGVSVLLTSYTHSAVDNILLKLKQCAVGFVRLGRVERIHPDIQPHAAEVLARSCTTVQQLEEFYTKQQVVATTCLGTNHVLFTRRRFDVCIVDEASQVLQPACLGPLFVSNKFVLVGDPRQLPPVVQSAEARDKGMAESLFARLDATGGTYELNVQYRMNSEIVRLTNELVYEGALSCGSEAVAEGRLHYTKALPQNVPQWCELAVSSQPGHEVLFLDTQKVDSAGIEDGGKVKNVLEASMVRYLIHIFIQLGVSQSDVGVIAPYRQQVLLLRDLLSGNLGQVEVNTVDQYQGRDKQVIVMSFVKQGMNDSKHVGGILQDLRRLNVALTRAKYKLILIGHIPTLTQFEPLQEVVRILRDNQIIQLPQDVHSKLKCCT